MRCVTIKKPSHVLCVVLARHKSTFSEEGSPILTKHPNNMSAAGASCFPPLKWAQRQDFVLITVPLQDCSNVSLSLPNGNALALRLTCNGKDYSTNAFELFADIIAEESVHVVRPRQIEIKLKKKNVTEDAFWPRLTKTTAKNAMISIDWNNWKDEDEVNGKDGAGNDMGDFGMGDFSSLMGGAGGDMGGFGGMDFGSAAGQMEGAGDEAGAEDEESMPPLE
jgi:hypothetical protein